jgi:hypothetical protein
VARKTKAELRASPGKIPIFEWRSVGSGGKSLKGVPELVQDKKEPWER